MRGSDEDVILISLRGLVAPFLRDLVLQILTPRLRQGEPVIPPPAESAANWPQS